MINKFHIKISQKMMKNEKVYQNKGNSSIVVDLAQKIFKKKFLLIYLGRNI